MKLGEVVWVRSFPVTVRAPPETWPKRNQLKPTAAVIEARAGSVAHVYGLPDWRHVVVLGAENSTDVE
jgi:hypothetical protein